jgi:5-(carboxyamino)imidazole ribonucleotide mutase
VGQLRGEDALLSIVQMPKGVPVATVAIGNAFNAGLLAVQILAAAGDGALHAALVAYKEELMRLVARKNDALAKRVQGKRPR